MPILHEPGVITPGQFGPIKIDFDVSSALFTFTISRTGIPSVIATIRSISASIASKIESAPVIGKPFQYRFFIDFILHEKVSYESTIEALTPLTIELKILGKYSPGKIDYA